MKINGIDVKQNRVVQLSYETEHTEITNESEWIRACLTPVFYDAVTGFKLITVTVGVYGDGKEDTIRNRSDFLSMLTGIVELDLDGYENTFRCVLLRKEIEETIKRYCHKVVLEFAGYEYGEEMAFSFTSSRSINVEGNMETPCIIEIIPDSHEVSFTISGVARNPITREDEPVTIKNLVAGKKVVINGEDCTVLQDGQNKYPETDFWEFPSLLPGTNQITLSAAVHTVTLKYRPRYF